MITVLLNPSTLPQYHPAFKNVWRRMIKDNEARFEEEDALEDEMAESEKEEKVEDVYKFQGNAPPVKAYPRRSPRRSGRLQQCEEQQGCNSIAF